MVPKLMKGAIIGIDPITQIPSPVIFQYNPQSVSRSMEASAAGNKLVPTMLGGPPKETIKMTVEIDATDQMEDLNPVAILAGIHPQLAALEIFLYPKSTDVTVNTILTAVGSLEITPNEGPLIILAWGGYRVVPVRITSMSITEEVHDTKLNPIQAKVELNMTVLNYNDFSITHVGYSMFLSHQIVKETLAMVGVISSATNLI